MLGTMVQESCSSPGTGTTVNLLGAATGRLSFITAFGSGAQCFYLLDDGTQSEWGHGIVTAGAPNTLTRATVVGNSAGTLARLNFTGTTRVISWPPSNETFLRNPNNGDLLLGTVSMGPLAGFRNLVINGNPTINQRGYLSGTATVAANQYTLDRWRVVTSGQSVTWTDSAGIRTVTAPAGGMEQVIEAGSNLGGQHTLSWTGTATALVNGGAVANGGTVTLTGNTDTTIRLSGGTWSLLQLERGGRATAFERRPVQPELALCQRFYQTLGHDVVPRFNALAGQSFIMPLRFPVQMRAAPTATPNFTGSTNIVANVINRITASGCSAEVTANVAGDAFVTLSSVTTFAAEL